jgi:hypothetical protein
MTKPKEHIFLIDKVSLCGRQRDDCVISYKSPGAAMLFKNTCTTCSKRMGEVLRKVRACKTRKMSYVEAHTGVKVD